MKHLTQFLSESLSINESVEKELMQVLAGVKDRVDDHHFIEFDDEVPIGENDACIDGIDDTGMYLRVNIMEHTDMVSIQYFSDYTLKEVIRMMKKMK